VSNTPLVSQAVRSPMVARSLLADPAERDTLLALPYSRTAKDKGGSSSSKSSSSRQPGGWLGPAFVVWCLSGLGLGSRV
jgi:hypothetical protein